jgi:chromosome segregation ATPase
VPENSQEPSGSSEDEEVNQAKHEAAEIVARARRDAEAILAEAQPSSGSVPSPLAALGDNAEEIIGQVRKLIKKQRLLQTERQEMQAEIESLKSERDELVQRLTDAVVRMEELATMADAAQGNVAAQPPAAEPEAVRASSPPPPPSPPQAQKPPPFYGEPKQDAPPEDTSLAARLRQAERDEGPSQPREDDSSLAARLERAERERNEQSAVETEAVHNADFDGGTASEEIGIRADGRSFYDRHSAKLPRLEGDGGRSVLSAIGDMRPESEPKGRKGRRRKK